MARAKCFFDDVKKKLDCSVCQEQFSEINEPKILKCLHTFCKTCLEAWIRQHREGELSCPTCRQITECPNSDINRLPSNLFYIQMLEIVEAYSGQGQEDSSQCGNCEQKASLKFYCSDCNCFLCEHCTETHKKWKSFKEHHIKEIGSFNSSDVQDYARKANVCKKHKDELRYYCDKCKICICRDCAILEHQDHNKISFEQGLEKKKSEISKRMQEVETVGILLKQQKESLQKRETRVNNSIDQATDEAHRFAEHCITLIRNHEATIIKELLNHKASFSSEFSSQMSSLDEKVKDVNSSLEFGKDILERNNLPEILNVEETLERRFQDFLSSPEFSRYIQMNNCGVKYEPRDMSNIEKELGKLSFSNTDPSLSIAQGKGLTEGLQGEDCCFTIVTKDWQGQSTYNETDLVNVDIQSMCTGKVTKSIITDVKDGCYEVKFRPEDAGEFRVSITVVGETIKGSPFHLKVLETNKSASSSKRKEKKEFKRERKSDFEVLLDKVGKDPKGLEGKHLRIERVPVCSAIHVKGLKKETSDDTIELYFENHRKSGGSLLSRVERKEKDEALVYFEDPSSVQEVIKRNHTLDQQNLEVKPYYPFLENTKANKKEMAFDSEVFDYIQMHHQHDLQAEYDKQRVHAELSEGSVLTICPTEKKIQSPQLWQKRTECLESFLTSFKKIQVPIAAELFDEITGRWEKQSGSSSHSGPSDYVLLFNARDQYAQIIGRKSCVEEEELKLKELIDAAKKDTELMKPIVQVEDRDIPMARLRLLKLSGTCQELVKRHQHLAISIDLINNRLSLKGPRSVLQEVKLEIYQFISKMMEKALELPMNVINVLKNPRVSEYAQSLLKQKNIPALFVPDLAKHSNEILVVGVGPKSLTDGEAALKNAIQERSLRLTQENMRVLENRDWKDLVLELNSSFKVGISEDWSSSTLWVSGIVGDVEKCFGRVQHFLAVNTRLSKI